MDKEPVIGIDYEFLEDKYILVTRDGRFYKRKDGEWERCTVTTLKGPSDYGLITQAIRGKQHNYYIHRLYAEAFMELPKDHNPRYVLAKDGNYFNLSTDNLYYAGDSERVTKMWEELDKQKVKCRLCGELHHGFDGSEACSSCRAYNRRLTESLERKEIKIKEIRETLDLIDPLSLSERSREMYYMRYNGTTFREIGEKFGITSEGVRYILKKELERNMRE